MAGRRRASPPSADRALVLGEPVRVTRIGAEGDGLAQGPGGEKLFLAGTLPGELVQPGPLAKRGDGWAGPAEIIERSPDRVAPPCPHFGPCGGCTLQHWGDAAYAEWKRARAAGGTGLEVGVLARTPPGARRRIDLAIRRDRTGVLLGLHRRLSREVVDMRACPILHPALFVVVQSARPVLARLAGLRSAGELQMNLLDSGPDLLLTTDAPLTAGDRTALASWAAAGGISRVAWRLGADPAEPAALLRPSVLALSGRPTPIPPGAFLQASVEGERAIVGAVEAALPAKLRGRIVELFAGCGTLTHALSEHAPVTAYESDPAACAALRRAGNPRVTVVERDLARQPLRAAELKGAAAVILDPPYAGAAAQMPGLAEFGGPVIYVSCNPATLVRDSHALLSAGYAAATAHAVDQFLWSTNIETVVGFERRRS